MGIGQPHDDPRGERYWLKLAEPRDERQERWALVWAQTLAFVLDVCSPPGGGEWTGKGIEEATGGRVGAGYSAPSPAAGFTLRCVVSSKP